jgi:hypothetical protein
MQTRHPRTRAAWLLPLLALIASPAPAEKKYGPGVTDTEIKIGQTMPYSGPVSAFGTMGRAETAYFEIMGGRRQRAQDRLLSLDDGYSRRTIEADAQAGRNPMRSFCCSVPSALRRTPRR